MWPHPIYANGYVAHTAKSAKRPYGKVWFVARLIPGKPALFVATGLTKKEAIARMA